MFFRLIVIVALLAVAEAQRLPLGWLKNPGYRAPDNIPAPKQQGPKFDNPQGKPPNQPQVKPAMASQVSVIVNNLGGLEQRIRAVDRAGSVVDRAGSVIDLATQLANAILAPDSTTIDPGTTSRSFLLSVLIELTQSDSGRDHVDQHYLFRAMQGIRRRRQLLCCRNAVLLQSRLRRKSILCMLQSSDDILCSYSDKEPYVRRVRSWLLVVLQLLRVFRNRTSDKRLVELAGTNAMRRS
jgi:hypothetical protein